jgi:hypothetical protein
MGGDSLQVALGAIILALLTPGAPYGRRRSRGRTEIKNKETEQASQD